MANIQWKLTDPVTVLPGIGTKKSERLRESGMNTLQDVLNFTGTSPAGFNISSLQLLIKQNSSIPAPPPPPPAAAAAASSNEAFTEKHSWFQRVGHVMVSNLPVRVHILELRFMDYGCVLHTTWFHNSKWHHRPATPLCLATVHYLWINNFCVSDDSESEDIKPEYLSIEPHLPPFEVFDESLELTKTQQDMLNLTIKETSVFNGIQ